MFIKNTADHDYHLPSFDGYEFILPAKKVCAIWDPAGKHIVTNLQKVEEKNPDIAASMPSKGIPAIYEIARRYWDGATYAEVKRFKIDHTRLPDRNALLRIAEERGVAKERLEKLRYENADAEEICKAINALPVPEEVRFPEKLEREELASQ